MLNEIDVMVTSASRPKLTKYVIDGFDKFVHFSGKFNKIWHEDFVYPEESEKVIKILKENESWSQNILRDKEPIKLSYAIKDMLENHVKSKYVFNMQDDWEFEMPVDLDHLIYIMEKHKHINCIFFGKRTNMLNIDGFKFTEEKYEYQTLLKHPMFSFLPGIWRTDFVRDNWEIADQGKPQEGWFNKKLNEKNIDHGAYLYGPLGYPRVVRHLGYSWAVKDWGTKTRLDSGYGGSARLDFVGKQDRAPWLPDEQERPKFLENKQEEYKEALKEFTKENVEED